MAVFIVLVIIIVVGVLGGLTGVGGVLLIPALTEILDMDPHLATGTALCSFIFPALHSSYIYYKKGLLDPDMTLSLAAGGLLFGYVGAVLKSYVSGTFITLVLAILVIVAGANALRPPKPGRFDIASQSLKTRRIFLFSLGAIVGVLGGISGSGGAVLTVPVMIICGFPAVPTVSASILCAVPTGVSGTIGNAVKGYIDWSVAAWIAPTLLIGMYMGTRLASRVNPEQLRTLVAILCLVTGVSLIFRVPG